MALDQIHVALDAIASAAAGNADKMPGLITVRTDDWEGSLRELRGTCKSLSDGIRRRDIVV